MPIRVLDTFTDTDATALGSHTPDTDVVGAGWQPTRSNSANTSGGGVIQGNQLQLAGDSNSGHVIDAGVSDCIVKIDWTPAVGVDNRCSVVFRQAGDGDLWTWNCREPNADWNLYRIDSFVGTTLETQAFTWVEGQTYELKVILMGASIALYIDNVLVHLETGATQYLTASSHGIVKNQSDNAQRFDNFEVSDLPTSSTLRPLDSNLRYWEHKGSPKLFLGGSDKDNLFQWPTGLASGDGTLADQLDILVANGGNYIRCALHGREHSVTALDQYPWEHNGSAYDLDTLNTSYFDRLNTLLTLCEARDIVVQIELFDGFDWTGDHWPSHPMNPLNNINYTEAGTGVPEVWTQTPGAGWNPVHTAVYDNTLTDPALIKGYLDAFMNRVLDETLAFPGTVLYCDGNETSNPIEWTRYWTGFVRTRAANDGVRVYVGAMRDQRPIDHTDNDPWYNAVPEDFDFNDISQATHNDPDAGGVTSYEPASWDQVIAVLPKTDTPVRPLNIVKTYHPSVSRSPWSSDGDGTKMGWRTFPRMVFAGAASVRFHRADSGFLGLSTYARTRIKACREADDAFGFIESTLATGLISGATTEVRCRERLAEERVAVLFIGDGSCNVDLTNYTGTLPVKWWDTHSGLLHHEETIAGGGTESLATPTGGSADSDWIAVIGETSAPAPEPGLDAWSRRFKVTTDPTKVSEAVTNLVYDLANAPTGFWDHVKSDGSDIRVTRVDGSTEVAREVVGFNDTLQEGLVFFATPDLSTSLATEYYIYFGNASASEPAVDAANGRESVWDANHLLVMHGHSLSLLNSAGSGWSPVVVDNFGDDPEVVVDFGLFKGIRLVDNTQFIEINGAPDFLTPLTIEEIIQAPTAPNTTDKFSSVLKQNTSNGDVEIALDWGHNDSPIFAARTLDGSTPVRATFGTGAANTVYWRGATLDGTNLRTYLDGLLVTTVASGAAPSSATPNIRLLAAGGGTFGQRDLSEVRVHNVARSDEWLSTNYENQSAPATFWSTATIEVLEESPDWLSGWNNRFEVTTDPSLITEAVTNLVYDLSNAPAAGFWAGVKADGGDIRVTRSDGTTEVAREVAGFNDGLQEGLLFFATPDLSTSVASTYYVYFGNAAASEPAADAVNGRESVWDANHLFVMHGHSTSLLNSTGSGWTPAIEGTTPSVVDFGIHKGLLLTGLSDAIVVSGAPANVRPWTVEEIFEMNAAPNGTDGFDTIGKWNNFAHTWHSSNPNSAMTWDGSNVIVASFGTGLANTPYWRASTNTGTQLRAFTNGSFTGTDADPNTPGAGSTSMRISNRWSGSTFDRIHAEVRIHDVARSDQWIATNYENQSDPTTFWTTGTVESPPVESATRIYIAVRKFNDIL